MFWVHLPYFILDSYKKYLPNRLITRFINLFFYLCLFSDSYFVPKAVQKKSVYVKPKAKEAIEISPNTKENLIEKAKQEKMKE